MLVVLIQNSEDDVQTKRMSKSDVLVPGTIRTGNTFFYFNEMEDF